jgi:hypothetical protein
MTSSLFRLCAAGGLVVLMAACGSSSAPKPPAVDSAPPAPGADGGTVQPPPGHTPDAPPAPPSSADGGSSPADAPVATTDGAENPPPPPPPATDGGMYSNPAAVKVPTFPDKMCPVNAGAGTAEVNAAIAMCSGMGGGVVTFAPGTYNVGSIHMASNVKLALNGATLKGTGTDAAEADPSPVVCSDDGHRHWHNALLWGENVTNIAVVGPGTLDGGGLDSNSQKLIAFKGSSVMLFDNVNHVNTGHFGYLLSDCHDITMTNLKMKPQRDGVDLMQCSNVNAHDLTITGGPDDAFALKSDCTSGKAVTTDNVTVIDSMFGSGDNALQIGSETWGDFQNITWKNITVIAGGKSGIGIQMNDGAVIKNMLYDNVKVSGASFPIFMSVTSLLRAKDRTAGHAENIRFHNVSADKIVAGNNKSPQESAVIVSGQAGNPHQGIVFDGLTINFPGGGAMSADPPEGNTLNGGVAYNPRFITPIPAYGMFIRHAKGVELHNVKFTYGQMEGRPAIIARDVDGLTFDGLMAQKGSSTVELDSVKNLTVTGSAPLPDGMMPAVPKMSY